MSVYSDYYYAADEDERQALKNQIISEAREEERQEDETEADE